VDIRWQHAVAYCMYHQLPVTVEWHFPADAACT
jgi:hypothetical protein